MSDPKIYLADNLYTGDEYLTDHAVIVNQDCIEAIVATSSLPQNSGPTYHIIAPAFIDIQIYGAHNKLLSVFPEASSLTELYDYCSKGGASHFMATVATNSNEVIYACIDAVKDYWQQGGKGCLGLHIEGPWINPLKKGAHLEEFIHSPSLAEVSALLAYGKGVIKIITLAPEVCDAALISFIQSNGVVVSAGHSNATYAQATQAFDAGIATATHLFNAMSALQHRSPGMVGAIFNHPTTLCSIVPDGFHVDFDAIKIAKKQMGERLFVITDAVAATSEGPYPHHLVNDKYESNGILSGSALTMVKAVQNLVTKVGIPLQEALRMASLYPARAIQQNETLGKIKIGAPANLVCLNEALYVENMVVAN